jgi:hypothetical protein
MDEAFDKMTEKDPKVQEDIDAETTTQIEDLGDIWKSGETDTEFSENPLDVDGTILSPDLIDYNILDTASLIASMESTVP